MCTGVDGAEAPSYNNLGACLGSVYVDRAYLEKEEKGNERLEEGVYYGWV